MGHRCCSKQKVKRGLWSPEEDEKLMRHITTHGHGSWSSVPKLAGLQRCGKSCRLRWINYLRPDLKKGSFTQEEEQIIIDVHRILGNRWAQIAKHLPGRTDNEVKNFWNSCIKKKLMSQGLDPQTHNLMSSHQKRAPNKMITSFVVSQNQKLPIVSADYFSVDSHDQIIKNCSSSADDQLVINPPFLALPNNQTAIDQYQNSNLKAQNSSHFNNNVTAGAGLHYGSSSSPLVEYTTPPNISSSTPPSLNVQSLSNKSTNLFDDFGIWGSSYEPFEAPRMISEGDDSNQKSIQAGQDHDHQQQQRQQDDHEKEKLIWEIENERDENFSSAFDIGFMESTLISGLMNNQDLSTMDYDLAWNYY